MKLTTLMTIKSILALVLGVTLLAVPNLVLELAGISGSPTTAIYGRTFGAAVLGVCCLTWFARNAQDSAARRAILLDLFVYDAIEFIVLLVVQLSGIMNAFGWVYVATYLFFSFSFAYFLLPQRKTSLYPGQ